MAIEKGNYNILKPYASYTLVCIFICLIPFSVCPADQDQTKPYHCVTQNENGSINWTTGKITAVGKAFPDDKMQTSNEWIQGAARADANRGVIKILKGIKLSKSQRVEEYAAQSDIILAGIEKTARDAVILKQYYTSALAVEMTIETSIFGGFLQLVLPEDIRQIPKISPDIMAKKMDIPVVPGDDSHGVNEAGLNVDKAIKTLDSLGFKSNLPDPILLVT